MPFFEPPEPKAPETPPERRERVDYPGARPTLWVPRYLEGAFVIAVSREAAAVVHGIACYPRGFGLCLDTVTRYEFDGWPDGPDHADAFYRGGHRGAELPPDLMRFGIEYSNGQKATSLDLMKDFEAPAASGERLRIHPCGGGGGGGRWSHDLWVTPLPPEGPVRFVCEWPAMGIEETSFTLDGLPFIEAAEVAKPIF